MAEPLGLVGSLIAIVQISSKVVAICYEYRRSVLNAPREISQILDEVASIRNIVERLVKIANDDEQAMALPSLSSMNQPDAPLARCLAELTSLKSRLKLEKGLRAKGRALIWPFKEVEVHKSLDNIRRIKGTLQLAISADSAVNMVQILASTRSLPLIQDKLSTLTLEVEQMSRGTKVREILDWLSAPDLSSKHESERQKHVQGTGQWLFHSEAYIWWKNKPDTTLWLNGFSGCGKTVLCAAIIEDIRTHCTSDPHTAMAYIYFDSNNGLEVDANSMLRTLITQLLYQKRALPACVVELHERHVVSGSESYRQDSGRVLRRINPPVEALEQVLRRIVGDMDHVYFVFDALDECNDIAQLHKALKVIEDIGGWSSGKIHMLATSRSLPDIQDCFESLGATCVPFDINQVDPDIRRSILAHLSNDPKMRKWPKAVKQDVETELMAQAQGMFRWLDCQLQMLRKCSTPSAIRRTLQSLPKSLDETYSKILMEIDDANCLTATRILQWLTFSIRPLCLIEMAETLAINVDVQDRPRYDPDLLFLDMREILNVCSSLVTTVEMSSNHLNSPSVTTKVYVKLAHSSVKEFLVSESIRTGVCSRFALEEDRVHLYLAESCMAYLIHIDIPLHVDDIASYPLVGYAAKYWIPHMLTSKASWDSKVLRELIMDLFDPEEVYYNNWTRIFRIDMPWRAPEQLEHQAALPPLYSAAYLGLDFVCDQLIQKGVDVNASGGLFGTPLQAAALGGHIRAVQRLLDAGASIDDQGGTFQTPLRTAASRGHEAIVKLLLERGAKPQIRENHNDRHADALFVAAGRGYNKICELLLNYGAEDYWTMKGRPGSALHAATLGGYKDVVHLLLLRGRKRDVPRPSIGRRSARSLNSSQYFAAALGHVDILRELMSFGITQEEALRYAARAGDQLMVEKMLADGANIDSPGRFAAGIRTNVWRISDHQRALQSAARGGHVVIVRELLSRGADPKLQTSCSNALNEAIKEANLEIIRLLVEAGANVNPNYARPLTSAAEIGNLGVLRILIEYGADINANKVEALRTAARAGHLETVKELINLGAKVPLKHPHDTSLMNDAAYGGSARIVRFLHENGVNPCYEPIDSDEFPNSDPMYTALVYHHPEVVIALLDAGVDINAFSRLGTPLCEAIRVSEEILAMQLLARGADVNLQKEMTEGTPLLYAIDHQMDTIVKMLLERHADANRRGKIYRSQPKIPLLLAAERGNLEIVRLLIEAGARVNEQDDGGFSALHCAARNSNAKVLKILIEEYQAELGLRLHNGSLSIHSAASRGNAQSVEVLLDAGLSVNATNNDGKTPLHWAADAGRWDNVQLLLDRGARTDVKVDGKLGLTPLDFAHFGRVKRSSWLPLSDLPQWSDKELEALFERLSPSKA